MKNKKACDPKPVSKSSRTIATWSQLQSEEPLLESETEQAQQHLCSRELRLE